MNTICISLYLSVHVYWTKQTNSALFRDEMSHNAGMLCLEISLILVNSCPQTRHRYQPIYICGGHLIQSFLQVKNTKHTAQQLMGFLKNMPQWLSGNPETWTHNELITSDSWHVILNKINLNLNLLCFRYVLSQKMTQSNHDTLEKQYSPEYT